MHLCHCSDGFGIWNRDSEKSNYTGSFVISLWSAPGRGSESLVASLKGALAWSQAPALRMLQDQTESATWGQKVKLLFLSVLYRSRRFQALLDKASSLLVDVHVFLAKCTCSQELACFKNCCVRAGQDILVIAWGRGEGRGVVKSWAEMCPWLRIM